MRINLLILLAGVLLLGAACKAPSPAQPAAAQPEYRPTATIKDIMDSLVDPGSDYLWDAVSSTVSAKGIEEKAPHTDEEWKEVRRHAIQLIEATNLLLVPGRKIAQAGEKSENPDVELGPDQIEALVNADRDSWAMFAHGLHDATMPALKAADAKDAAALLDAGDAIDQACEKCHLKYWYPNEGKGKEAPDLRKKSEGAKSPDNDMKRYFVFLSALMVAAAFAATGRSTQAAPQAGTGSIKGHIRISGKLPGNTIIRMGVDPMCGKLNAGKRVLQEIVVANAQGDLANVFVRVQGSFPQTPVPAQPVTIDQRACIYFPRVVGARVGQTLQIHNSDPFLHNVHSVSARTNSFNFGQPTAGVVTPFKLKDEEIMLGIKCDVHRWMTAYVGVVTNPYFAVSGDGGTFVIDKVPAGTHTVQAWHERFGMLTKTVTVKAGAVATPVEFVYTGAETPAKAGIQDITVPGEDVSIQLVARSEGR